MKLNQKASLITLTLKAWDVSKIHKSETSEVNKKHAVNAVARVSVKVCDSPLLQEIEKNQSAARVKHDSLTLPTGMRGMRLIPAALIMDHAALMSEFIDSHARLTRDFLAIYPQVVNDAPARMRDLFNAKFFPETWAIGKKFEFSSKILPCPEGGQWDEWLQEASQEAEEELRDRVKAAIGAVVDRLGNPDAIFRDTLISNLKGIVDLAEVLNLTDAGDIRDAVDAVRDVAGMDADLLRTNPAERQSAANKARRAAALFA